MIKIKEFPKEIEDRIKMVIGSRLTRIPEDIIGKFPKILQNEGNVVLHYGIEDYFILSIIEEISQKKHHNEFPNKFNTPFPGLLKSGGNPLDSAFKFKSGFNNFLLNNTVQNLFSIDPTKDTGLFIQNHRQIINLESGETIDYVIPLAYIIFYGNVVDDESLPIYLDEIIAFSVNTWLRQS